MPEPTTTTTTTKTALEILLEVFENAKGKVRETQGAIADLGTAIKDVTREQKAHQGEVEAVRTALAKLQSIRV